MDNAFQGGKAPTQPLSTVAPIRSSTYQHQKIKLTRTRILGRVKRDGESDLLWKVYEIRSKREKRREITSLNCLYTEAPKVLNWECKRFHKIYCKINLISVIRLKRSRNHLLFSGFTPSNASAKASRPRSFHTVSSRSSGTRVARKS